MSIKSSFLSICAFPYDPQTLGDWCARLNAAVPMPWIILSAGVDIDQFVMQVEIACKSGASGFLAGRALWKDSVKIADDAARQAHLGSAAVANLQRCVELAEKYATPFERKLGQEAGSVHPSPIPGRAFILVCRNPSVQRTTT